jgi:hypothetical protein
LRRQPPQGAHKADQRRRPPLLLNGKISKFSLDAWMALASRAEIKVGIAIEKV